jgi:hypothetical protein
MILGLALSATAHAQTAPAKKAAPAPPPVDTRPLARYASRDKLVALVEYAGVDAHRDAWEKTAASKMLGTTPLGAMLEDLGAQLFDKVINRAGTSKTTGAQAVAIARHVLHSGFLFAATGGADPKEASALLVIRGGARRDVGGTFARLLLSLGGKPQVVAKAGGRQVVVMPGASPGSKGWAWFAEKEDVFVALDRPETADLAIEVLDGKRPNAADHPTRAALVKPDDGLVPALVAFVDVPALGPAGPNAPGAAARAQFAGVKRVDYRWGFQDTALMSVLRVAAPKPRQGVLTVLDQPTFDKSSMPLMPAGVEDFVVASVQPAKVFDAVAAAAKAIGPDAEAKFNAAVEEFRVASRLQLRRDVLAHLGPKFAFYVPPETGKPPATAAGVAVVALPGLIAMIEAIQQQLPRFVAVAEIDNPATVNRSLDDVILWANKQLKAQAAAAPKPAPPPGTPPPPAEGEDEGPPPVPEFKRMPGTAAAYSLVVPSELGRLPGNLRPTIRVGPKHVAIATSPDLARQALEVRSADAWTPPAEIAPSFAKLPSGLIALGVSDPRDTLPKTLAGLPGQVQANINTAILRGAMPPVGATPPGGAPATPPGGAPAPPPGAPGGEGAPPAAPPTIVLQVDPAKLPSADALKALMFPSTVAAAVDDQGLRVIRRGAFPDVSEGRSKALSAILMPAIQQATKAAAEAALKKAGGAPPGAGPPGATTPPTAPPPAPAPNRPATPGARPG